MRFRRKNNLLKKILFFLVLSNLVYSQKSIRFLKYDLHYSFNEMFMTGERLSICLSSQNIDSVYLYSLPNKKITIKFAIESVKGACKFTLVDSVNKIILSGQFEDGIAELKKQNSIVTSTGDEKIILKSYYQGIQSGLWICTDFNNKKIKEEKYIVKRRKRKECLILVQSKN